MAHHFFFYIMRTSATTSPFVTKGYLVRSQIRCHYYETISERNCATLCICHVTLIQDLEENVEYIHMRFFYLIEKNNGIRFLTYSIGKHASLIIPNISWRRPDEACDRVFFHVF
uniref:Uncharacterized protein n=1 Tax=Micromonas pusilla TaxID=38833 RepID=A0A6U2C8U1_MICPS|mmetsp:Transcript_15000/g.58730  ORF Transcript_15000/g.58730 Transcript_15000/m.58730 type:complete len:114 (+) Transcript_15000:1110-1451(+)